MRRRKEGAKRKSEVNTESEDSPIRVGSLGGLLLGGDDGLQVCLALLAAAVGGRGCGACDLLGLLDRSLLNTVGAIHDDAAGVRGVLCSWCV